MIKVMSTASATVNRVAEVSYVYCSEEHLFDNCPRNPASINYVGNCKRQNEKNPYSNTRSTEFRQHPNFSLSNQNKNQYAKTSNGQNIYA